MFLPLIQNRRSIRKYQDKAVEDTTIDLLDGALNASENARAVTIESHGSEIETLIESIAKTRKLVVAIKCQAVIPKGLAL